MKEDLKFLAVIMLHGVVLAVLFFLLIFGVAGMVGAK